MDLTCREDGDFLIVEVKDTGPGISKEYLESVFTPFFRVGATAPKFRERVVGLAIAKAAAKRAGAEVKLVNQKEGGLCAQIKVKKHISVKAFFSRNFSLC